MSSTQKVKKCIYHLTQQLMGKLQTNEAKENNFIYLPKTNT